MIFPYFPVMVMILLPSEPLPQFCGMVNRKAVGVAEKDGKIVLQTKRATRVNKKAWAKKALVKSKFANHKHQAAVAITAAASNRKDLAGPAIARYHAIKKQQQ